MPGGEEIIEERDAQLRWASPAKIKHQNHVLAPVWKVPHRHKEGQSFICIIGVPNQELRSDDKACILLQNSNEKPKGRDSGEEYREDDTEAFSFPVCQPVDHEHAHHISHSDDRLYQISIIFSSIAIDHQLRGQSKLVPGATEGQNGTGLVLLHRAGISLTIECRIGEEYRGGEHGNIHDVVNHPKQKDKAHLVSLPLADRHNSLQHRRLIVAFKLLRNHINIIRPEENFDFIDVIPRPVKE